MSGTFNDISVPPALISFAVSVCDADKVTSNEFKQAGNTIVHVPLRRKNDDLPDFDKYKESMKKITQLIADGSVISAQPLGKGGLFMALVKMAIGNKIGADIKGLDEGELLGIKYGDMLVEMPAGTDVDKAFGTVNHVVLGTTTEDEKLKIECGEKTLEYTLDEIISRWEKPLEEVFPTRTAEHKTEKEPNVENISFTERLGKGPAIKVARPKVVIPVLPGTNCEVDSKRAFEQAGADVSIQIINNLSELDLIESINQMSNKIKESQIIMLPGGFSGGDEPDGSAKFMTAVFRNPLISEAVRDLMDNRDGLMLEIGRAHV